ncbi:MAG: hypothetical protein K6E73_07295 [Bacteroidales bacterium]|nr:hypothetical protein [Bacteroidales bacterium]
MRKILYFPALMVLGLLIAASSCQSSSSKLSQEQIDSINQMKLDSARIADSIIAAKKHYEDSVKRVSDSIESIKRHDKMINRICEEFQHFVFTDVSDIQRFYSIIDYDARVINQENNIKLKKDLKKKLIAFQVKNYPKARKIWAQSASRQTLD